MGGQRALPEEVVQSLRQAFAVERDVRLAMLREPDSVLPAAHALSSSAWVVGEREISALARSVEESVEAGTEPADLTALVDALERWVL